MDRVALLMEPCLSEVFYEEAPAGTVTEGSPALAVKDNSLLLGPSPQPNIWDGGEGRHHYQIDHPSPCCSCSPERDGPSCPDVQDDRR